MGMKRILVVLVLITVATQPDCCSAAAVAWTSIPTTTVSPPTTTTTGPTNSTQPGSYDAFISYRRAPSRSLAMLLKVLLAESGIKAFLDVDNLRGGPWNAQLMSAIQNSPNFILVLSKTTLDRTLGDDQFNDTLHQEIREAVKLKKHIIPVFDEYDFPNPGQFSSPVQVVFQFQGVEWEHAMAEGSLEKLIRYMQLVNPKPALPPGA